MFTVDVIDRATDRLRRLPEELRAKVRSRLVQRGQQLVRLMRQKLNGSVLKKRSGKLYNSIRATLHETNNDIWMEAGSYGVRYAAIHEYGGKTKPHIIRPKNALALHFVGSNGANVFAKVVHHPGSKIPQRSYVHSSLNEMRATLLRDAEEMKRNLWPS